MHTLLVVPSLLDFFLLFLIPLSIIDIDFYFDFQVDCVPSFLSWVLFRYFPVFCSHVYTLLIVFLLFIFRIVMLLLSTTSGGRLHWRGT